MSGRPSRSSSIPIPRSSSNSLPSLDDVFAMPFSTSPLPLPRPRLSSGVGVQTTPPPFSTSPPARPTSRSYTSGPSFILPRRPSATAATNTSLISTSPVLPRIIRASTNSSNPSASWADVACSPPAPSTSPTRGRRPSAGAGAVRAPSTHRPPHVHGSSLTQPPAQPTPAPAPFPLPSYLEHSALRHLLQTELPPHLPPSRYGAPPPTVWPYPAHRDITPATDSDDDSTASPPPQRASGTGAGRAALESVAMVGSCPVFRLPTRWSEQDRHIHLSVSADGRELTYNGAGFTGSCASWWIGPFYLSFFDRCRWK
ncbi:hypothetical protein DENSPDRAFT_464371 [Dentipellis sp. KUC8613]|nr:hypothetical protein DENSPDRAFT_464371 [Dentipellis sp. KUC8613]